MHRITLSRSNPEWLCILEIFFVVLGLKSRNAEFETNKHCRADEFVQQYFKHTDFRTMRCICAGEQMVQLFPRLPQMRRMEWEAYLANPHILDDVDPLILDLLSSRSLITVPGRWIRSYWFRCGSGHQGMAS